MADAKMRGVVAELYNSANKIAGLSDYTIKVDAASVDVSDHDSGSWGEEMPTTSKWSASGKLWYLGDGTTGVGATTQKALRDALPLATQLTVEFRPFGTGTGKAKYSGTCRVKGWSVGAPTSGAQNFDVELVGVGALTEGTQT